uniref:Uncharacterized protein n=1 Tax=Thermogemmatispora argillosa TaxID=2045280 RepID=A0A455T1U9_9CHLR|nr:hypothetical protein KTA_15280 [Thermogemmatispora argillosa]
MSEFEEQAENRECRDAVSFSFGGRRVTLPPDFSEEEVAFAQELDTLFSLPEEEIPPYFVHTLLESEDPRFAPVDPGFEQRIRSRVFQRLKLQRRLFVVEERRVWKELVHGVGLSRRLLLAGVSLLLFMLLTMLITAPSFASGLVILLQGVQSGVYPVHGPLTRPVVSSPLNTTVGHNDQVSLLAVQRELHFPLYWPTEIPNHYVLRNIYLYSDHVRGWPVWTDGPMLEFRYSLMAPGSPWHEAGELAIREFKPHGQVYQVVEADAIHPLQVDDQGRAAAIYVEGQWVTINTYARRWIYNGHCELLTQRNGVVFWIAGQCVPQTGLNVETLLSVADSLEELQLQHLLHAGVSLVSATEVNRYLPGPFDGVILSLSLDSSLDSPYLRLVGPDQPADGLSQAKGGASHSSQAQGAQGSHPATNAPPAQTKHQQHT